MEFHIEQFDELIRRTLVEDIGAGDVTTNCIIPETSQGRGRIIAKAPGLMAGLELFRHVFFVLDKSVAVTPLVCDGDWVEKGAMIATISGPTRVLLSGERTALNFLQRMSGIATLTRQYAAAVADTRAIILDTRKTAPGLRLTDKWAVQFGGGQNHRMGLYDMVLIKENHIAAAGSITAAVNCVRQNDPRGRAIEVEVTNLNELYEALALHVDRIMLDNMSLAQMKEAVTITAGRIPLEASGNVNLDTIRAIAETGVDYISIGALTHSVQAMDISFLLED